VVLSGHDFKCGLLVCSGKARLVCRETCKRTLFHVCRGKTPEGKAWDYNERGVRNELPRASRTLDAMKEKARAILARALGPEDREMPVTKVGKGKKDPAGRGSGVQNVLEGIASFMGRQSREGVDVCLRYA